MKKVDGIWIEETEEEIVAMQEARARAEAEEKHRPLSQEEVTTMLLRQQINTLAIDDATAYRMREFYPEWADLVSIQYTTDKTGFKFMHNGKLYKTIPTGHTFASQWVPGSGTESIYVRIDETHAGNKYDPIPASRGMEYTYGLYYTDQEDSKLYLCKRIGAQAGDKIILQYLPHELIGQYFEVIE